MTFNSLQFILFFSIVTFMYFLLPHKYRLSMLLFASCIFYMISGPVYILIIAALTIVSYFSALLVEKSKNKLKSLLLVMNFLAIGTVFFIFKYLNFFNANLCFLANILHWNYPISILKIIAPLGLSFYILHIAIYVIEVYLGRQKAEQRFDIYALYIMFYPKLIAGPIERPYDLIPQFYKEHPFDYNEVTNGLKLMAWGIFQKVVIADRLAVLVNAVFNNPRDYQGISFVVAAVFLAFQVYCDFSGYSDIARGAAQVMGFRLTNNFNRPYFSKSIAEFWRRWHISFSTCLRDYLYKPLAFYRMSWGIWGIVFAIIVTFFLCGLWHGATWTFIIWGILNGIYLAVGLLTKSFRIRLVKFIKLDKLPTLHKFIQAIITFSLVCFAFIFFKANNVSDAYYIAMNSISGTIIYPINLVANISLIGKGKKILAPILSLSSSLNDFFIAVFFIVFLLIVHMIQRRGSIREMLSMKSAWIRWAFYYGLVVSIIILGVFKHYESFVYVQF